MTEIYHHGALYTVNNFLNSRHTKSTVILLAIELMLYVFTVYKGLGFHYLPITCFIMLFTAMGCGVVFYIKADCNLFTAVVILLNLGFVVQEIESGSGVNLSVFLLKFTVAAAAALLAGVSYYYGAEFLASDRGLMAVIGIQLFLCTVLCFFGNEIGSRGYQSATLTIRIAGISITPFEIVKVLYLFAAAALLCFRGQEELRIGRLKAKKETLFMWYTLFLSLFFLACKELGTLMIVYLTGLAMLWIFGKDRKMAVMLVILTAAGMAGIWILCDSLLYPMEASGKLVLPSVLKKLAERFGTALHPERAVFDAGYQGTLELEALAVGGLLGIGTERHRMPLPEASSDMIFANVVQTCGFLMGTVILLSVLALLKRGIFIASACEDIYFQGSVMAASLLMAIEGVVHIGYNIVLFPITGIPLYFVSQGFTAVVSGMVLVSVQLVISAGIMERRGR